MIINDNEKNYEQEKLEFLLFMRQKKFKPETTQKFRSFLTAAEKATQEYVVTIITSDADTFIGATVMLHKDKEKRTAFKLYSGFFIRNAEQENRFTSAEIKSGKVAFVKFLEIVSAS